MTDVHVVVVFWQMFAQARIQALAAAREAATLVRDLDGCASSHHAPTVVCISTVGCGFSFVVFSYNS